MTKRRDFLKFSTASLVVTGLGKAAKTDHENRMGRILHLVETRQTPDENAPITARLLPDSVQPILAQENGWIRLLQGYVPASAIQPMNPPNHLPITRLPSWVEVIAPYAAVRAWASAEAPLVRRLDHAAAARAVYALEDDQGAVWLQIELDGQLSGWVQRAHLQPALHSPSHHPLT